jgi:hypothetical protein
MLPASTLVQSRSGHPTMGRHGRPVRHASVRPFRVLKAAVDAHRKHGPTPFVGCAICARRTMFTGAEPRWAAPRLG